MYSEGKLDNKNVLFLSLDLDQPLDFSLLHNEQLKVTAIVGNKKSQSNEFIYLTITDLITNQQYLHLYNSNAGTNPETYGIIAFLFPAVLPWNKIHGTIAGGYGSIYDLKEHYLIGATGDDGITDIQFNTPTPFTYDGNSYVITLFRHYKTIDRPSGELDNKEVLSYFVIDEQLYGE